ARSTLTPPRRAGRRRGSRVSRRRKDQRGQDDKKFHVQASIERARLSETPTGQLKGPPSRRLGGPSSPNGGLHAAAAAAAGARSAAANAAGSTAGARASRRAVAGRASGSASRRGRAD